MALTLAFLSFAGYSDTMLELLLFALEDLKMVLKSQESDLLIGLGNAEDVVLKLANEVTMQGTSGPHFHRRGS